MTNRGEKQKNNPNSMIGALKQGYKESGAFNLEYAEMCMTADNEAMAVCEEKLSECE